MKKEYNELNDYQKEQYNKAKELKKEVEQLGFNVEIVEKEGHSSDSYVVIDNKYLINKNYKDIINISMYKRNHFKYISYSKGAEIMRKHEGHFKNMKVMSTKKINERLKAIDNYIAELKELNEQYKQERIAFLDTLKDENVIYYHDEYKSDEITGGYIYKNGLEFSFELGKNGYIGKKIELNFFKDDLKADLKTFNKLADNKLN